MERLYMASYSSRLLTCASSHTLSYTPESMRGGACAAVGWGGPGGQAALSAVHSLRSPLHLHTRFVPALCATEDNITRPMQKCRATSNILTGHSCTQPRAHPTHSQERSMPLTATATGVTAQRRAAVCATDTRLPASWRRTAMPRASGAAAAFLLVFRPAGSTKPPLECRPAGRVEADSGGDYEWGCAGELPHGARWTAPPKPRKSICYRSARLEAKPPLPPALEPALRDAAVHGPPAPRRDAPAQAMGAWKVAAVVCMVAVCANEGPEPQPLVVRYSGTV